MAVHSLIDSKKREEMRKAVARGELSKVLTKKGGKEPAQDRIALRKSGEEDQAMLDALLLKHAAVGNKEKIKSLIQSGANVEAKGEHGETALFVAAMHNHSGAAGELVFTGKADLNAADMDGTTALMVAAANGHDEIVLLLIEAGADAYAKDKDGMTALKHAEQNGHAQAVKLLKGKGGK